MILGIGADVLKIKRLGDALKKNQKMVDRLFTPSEIKIATKLSPQKKNAYYAKRFAGKEAVSKACGTGIGKEIKWQDIEILNDKNGAPIATFSKKEHSFLCKKFKVKKIKVFISLSDEKEYALAFALLDASK